ncbi:MAG: hypothetical protein M1838_003474 [Thelocarpon superellum]|nr:MAG: hypothetical protein M1838_003474 [Thelocarpon superellum]
MLNRSATRRNEKDGDPWVAGNPTPSNEPHVHGPTPIGHKRSVSGSILAKLSFLRGSYDQETSQVNAGEDGPIKEEALNRDGPSEDGAGSNGAPQPVKNRRRKGSLRKTALMGPARHRLQGRDHRGSSLQTPQPGLESLQDTSPTSPEKTHGYRNYHFPEEPHTKEPPINGPSIDAQPSHDAWTAPRAGAALVETSTTDDEDVLTFPRRPVDGSTVQSSNKALSTKGDSYFPPQSSGSVRRRTSNKNKPAPSILPPESPPALDEWDYSETAWWGWVMLIVTWVVFVVGMGSCLEVWCWAWDVGETPPAPPELENDPTLPIVGYYPALMILTAVMAWVWVVVAWIGMKYFKHAKISGEDL